MSKSKRYTLKYFYDKLSAIPKNKWTRGYLTDGKNQEKHCLLGHLGVQETSRPTEEAITLHGLLFPYREGYYSNYDMFALNDTAKSNEGARAKVLAAIRKAMRRASSTTPKKGKKANQK